MAIPITDENRNDPPKKPMRVTWETKVFRTDGTLKETKSGENSLVAGFAFFIFQLLSVTPADTEHDITNALRIGYQMWPGTTSQFNGVLIGNTYLTTFPNTSGGIIVGTNNTAVTADDYKLNTATANGFAANQLNYYACQVKAVVTDATSSSMIISRVMSNNSGGAIVIKELGIYYYNSGGFTFCACRDIIADPGTTIANGEYMQVKYTITVTEA